jgi:hypothetical protein
MSLLAVMAVCAGVSCSRSDQVEDPPIARVEDASLTLDDLNKQTVYSNFSFGETAERWIDEQVLAQHAEKSGIIDSRSFITKLEDHERQLIAHILLDSLLRRHIQIDQEQLREYYANNLPEFQLPDEAALVIHIGFRRQEDANRALDMLNQSALERDSVLSQYNYDHQLVQRSRIVPVLSEEIFRADVDRFYGPVETEFGYHVIMVERFFRLGETIPFILVRKQIFERLFQMRLPLARSAILDSLREVLDVEVYND